MLKPRPLMLTLVAVLLPLFANAQSQMWCDQFMSHGSINCLCGNPAPVDLFTTGFVEGVCLGRIVVECDPGCGSTYARAACATCSRQGKCGNWLCVDTQIPPQQVSPLMEVSERISIVGCGNNVHLLRDVLRAKQSEKIL